MFLPRRSNTVMMRNQEADHNPPPHITSILYFLPRFSRTPSKPQKSIPVTEAAHDNLGSEVA